MIAMDEHGRQFTPAPAGADGAVLMRKVAVDFDLVESCRMTDVGEPEALLLGPEKRHRFVCLFAPDHVQCRRLPLMLGHHPMLDPDRFTGPGVGPDGDVPR